MASDNNPPLANNTEEIPTEQSVREMIVSAKKRDQQRALLLVRKLPPDAGLRMVLLLLAESTNDFVRASAAVTLGQLQLPDPHTRADAVRELITLLHSDRDYGVRAGAAAGLGYYDELNPGKRTAVIDALTRALFEDTQWQVQFSALAALGEVRDARALPVVLPCLRHDNSLMVQAAVGAVGNIGEPSTVPHLLGLLGSSDMMTRQKVAQALGCIEDARKEPAVLDALRTLARDQSLAVRDAAKGALQRFGCATETARKSELSDADLMMKEVNSLLAGDETGDAPVTAGDALRRRLERSFDMECTEGTEVAHRQIDMRTSELAKTDTEQEALQSLSEEEFQQAVRDLKDGDVSQQTMALIALRRTDPDRARSVVLQSNALDPDKYSLRIRSLAVRLVAQAKDMDTIMHTLRNDPEENVRSACCDAFAEAGGGGIARKACIEVFESDEHWLVRISAAIALGSIGKDCNDVEQTLIRSLRQGGVSGLTAPQSSVVRRHAIIALGFLGSINSLPTLRALVDDPDTEQPVRLRIANALRGIPSKESVEILHKLVTDEHEEVAEMAQVSLDTLTQRGFA